MSLNEAGEREVKASNTTIDLHTTYKDTHSMKNTTIERERE